MDLTPSLPSANSCFSPPFSYIGFDHFDLFFFGTQKTSNIRTLFLLSEVEANELLRHMMGVQFDDSPVGQFT